MYAATPDATVLGPRPPPHVRTPPGPALLLIANVTVVVLFDVTVLPKESCTATDTLNVPVPVAWMFCPAVGCVVKASFVAALGLIVSVCVPFGARPGADTVMTGLPATVSA